MKTVISSEYLYSKLVNINFNHHNVSQIEVVDNDMFIYYYRYDLSTNQKIEHQIELELSNRDDNMTHIFPQSKVRWDWIVDTLRYISERPIVVEINDNRFNIILEF